MYNNNTLERNIKVLGESYPGNFNLDPFNFFRLRIFG